MSLILQLIVLMVLGAMVVQDFRIRAIHIYWFCTLLAAVFILNRDRLFSKSYWEAALVNLELVGLLFSVLTAYCSLKARRIVVITRDFMGLGDFLFLIILAFYLSVLNFLFFYVLSVALVLLCWTLWLFFSGKKNQTIPFAGFQAILLLFFLSGDWFWLHFNVRDDFWLWRIFFYQS